MEYQQLTSNFKAYKGQVGNLKKVQLAPDCRRITNRRTDWLSPPIINFPGNRHAQSAFSGRLSLDRGLID